MTRRDAENELAMRLVDVCYFSGTNDPNKISSSFSIYWSVACNSETQYPGIRALFDSALERVVPRLYWERYAEHDKIDMGKRRAKIE